MVGGGWLGWWVAGLNETKANSAHSAKAEAGDWVELGNICQIKKFNILVQNPFSRTYGYKNILATLIGGTQFFVSMYVKQNDVQPST